MSKYSTDSYKKSIEYASKGVRLAVKSQKNFRFQLAFTLIVIMAAVLLKFSPVELCLTIFAAGLVLTAELLNSAIEFGLDSVYHNRKSIMVGMAKDISAAGVWIATCTAIIIGSILFFNHIFDFIIQGYFWF